MRHFVTRQRINVNVAAARLLARPDVPARPLPSPTASSQPLPPRPAMPLSDSIRSRAADGPAPLPRSPQPRRTSKETPVQPKEKARRARGPEEASQARSPPPPIARLNAERGTADPSTRPPRSHRARPPTPATTHQPPTLPLIPPPPGGGGDGRSRAGGDRAAVLPPF
ncbi:hypothetical protein PAL_GLEAN10026002 [Pteropus alecto]|uniref:Uncharacterized protein n=1 Tax=Pteropus alecto TaxID=9402 RepID=L5K063_PTEAL|nr:hypothetical protein PAL_GLEAN10026002 [Pteropus alecto]